MDVFILLVTVFGLLYLFIMGVRWAFHLDRDEWRKRERLKRRHARKVNGVFDDIVARLRDDK